MRLYYSVKIDAGFTQQTNYLFRIAIESRMKTTIVVQLSSLLGPIQENNENIRICRGSRFATFQIRNCIKFIVF